MDICVNSQIPRTERKDNMKKGMKLVLAAAFTGMITIQSFGFGWNFGGGNQNAAQTEASAAGYVFSSGDLQIPLNAEAGPILQALGSPLKVFEQDSCAYQGKDKVYTYPEFELSAYPCKGKELISSVYISGTSTAATPEGIRIGSAKADVLKTYGTPVSDQWGVFRYEKADSILLLYMTGDKVDTIEYRLLNTVQ